MSGDTGLLCFFALLLETFHAEGRKQMKLSVVIAGAGAPDCAFVVWRGFKASIDKARRFGYQGVELALGSARDIDQADLDEQLRTHGLCASCISTGLTYAQMGLYMTHPSVEKRNEIVNVFHGLVLLAKDRGGFINVGRARGFIAPDQTREQARDLFLECMEQILPFAKAHEVTILIEPVNRYESNFINSVDEAGEILARLPYENTGIMADLFHMNIEDDRIGDSLRRNANRVKYIHIADSNRRAPGQGHINFDEILDTLIDIGYDGWLSAEVLPGANADETALLTAKFMRARLNKRGALS